LGFFDPIIDVKLLIFFFHFDKDGFWIEKKKELDWKIGFQISPPFLY